MADETGHIHWYNQRWYDYTGTTFEEMLGLGESSRASRASTNAENIEALPRDWNNMERHFFSSGQGRSISLVPEPSSSY
jgi:PAS domain-containing protein